MIELQNLTLLVPTPYGSRAVLEHVSAVFPAGIVHIESEVAADRRKLIHLLSGRIRPTSGGIFADGAVSWPLGTFGAFWGQVSGYDSIEFLCRVFDLDYGSCLAFFEDVMDDSGWLESGFDQWPRSVQQQFLYAAFIAPEFDVYLLDATPIPPQADFLRRWTPLFRQRIAGKTVIMASGHRAARTAYPGAELWLSSGRFSRVAAPSPGARQ